MKRSRKASSLPGRTIAKAAWQQVKVDDTFFTGADVGGFLGLEELAPASVKTDDQTRPAKRRKKKDLKHHTSSQQSKPDEVWIDEFGATAVAEQEEIPIPATSTLPHTQIKASAVPKAAPAPAPADAKQPPCIGKKAAAGKPKRARQEKGQPAAAAPPSSAVSADKLATVKAWERFGLHPQLLSSLADKGFTDPTPIQQRCISTAIWDRRNIVGAAQTGSGKTLAFGLPILHAILAHRDQLAASSAAAPDQEAAESLQALIFAPTRELAMQVAEHLRAFAKPAGVWVVPVVGGMSSPKQRRLLAKKPPIVVATPGRLWELLRDGEPHLATLGSLRFLVLDEADRMVQAGHFQDLSLILEQIPGYWNKEGVEASPAAGSGRPSIQTFVFSATLTLPASLRKRLHKGGGGAVGSMTLEALLDRIALHSEPKIVDLTSERKIATEIAEAFLQCGEKERDELLYYLIAHHTGRTLVFTNAISGVRRLAAVLAILQLPVHALHAGMQQRQRLTALDRFRANPQGVLVATDVAARGLDIPEVATVVHYQLPASADMYVHRSGRTGRAGTEGTSIALVTPRDAPRFAALLQALQRPEPPRFPIDTALQRAVKKRMQLALRIDGSAKQGKKAASESRWQHRMAQDLDMEISDEDKGDIVQQKGKGQAVSKSQVAAWQRELAHLLQEPLQAHVSTRFFAGQQGTEGEGGAQHVQLAAKLAASRKAGQASVASKSRRKSKTADGAKRKRGLVVPLPYGRADGADALAALKRHIASL